MGKTIQETNLFNFDFPFYKITKPIRLIELFGGVGSQAKALKNIGANFEHYKLVEFDKYCIKSYNAIHETDFNTQDIKQVKGENLEIVDTDKFTYLLTYSFPCQDLSLAGKQRGMTKGSGTRSGLLWEVERLLNETENLPQVLLMENVPQVHGTKNIDDFYKWIDFLKSKGYSNFWQDLNAKDYGVAQNRKRCFMVSILGNEVYEFPEPIKLNKCMKDYLEDEVDEKYFLSEEQVKRIETSNYVQNQRRIQSKDYCDTLCARYWKDPKCIQVGQMYGTEKQPNPQAGRVYDSNGLCPTLDTCSGGNRMPIILIKETTKKGYVEVHKGDGLHIRKLTPKECWRLMGFADEDFEKAEKVNSNSQLYKQAGNSIVVKVLEEIFKKLF